MKFIRNFLSLASSHRLIIAAAVFILLNVFIFSDQIIKAFNPPKYPEAAEILTKTNFDALASYMKNVAKEKGAVYAFDLLAHVPLPSGIDQHLIGHEVGDVLYEQKGAKGIYDCTPVLRNACSHSIVTNYLEEHGKAS